MDGPRMKFKPKIAILVSATVVENYMHFTTDKRYKVTYFTVKVSTHSKAKIKLLLYYASKEARRLRTQRMLHKHSTTTDKHLQFTY